MTEPPLTTHHEPRAKTDWLLLSLLLALVLPLRVWLICNTEVTARDSIGYIRYALQFEQYGWKATLLKNHQHPGYPLLVSLVSQPVRAIAGETTPDNMELSAQLVNFAASLLLLLPMYLLGRQFFDRQVSFFGTLLYQYLPIGAQNLSDGISEPIFLLLMVSGLLQAVQAVRDRSAWRCVWFGLFTGLAYLVRPEGALLLPAFASVLLAMQLRQASRWTWCEFFSCGAAAATSAALVGAIYVGTTGKFSNKPTVEVMTGQKELITMRIPAPDAQVGPHLFAASFPREDVRFRIFRSVWALIAEINQGFHYLAGIPAILGLAWSCAALRKQPGFWVLGAYVGIHSSVLIVLAMVACYVSDRHVMILVLLGCFFVVVGLRELPLRAFAWLRHQEKASPTSWLRSPSVWFAILFVALVGVCLPRATQRLHGNRVGNHAAGLWLSKHVDPTENPAILDDHNWSHFFAGMLFHEGREPAYPRDHPSTCYVVTTRARDPQVDAARQASVVAADAKVVYVWPENAEVAQARVVVYAQPRSFEKYPWRVPGR